MKPVIKKQTHYNVLLMRDDGAARTFRMHSTALKVLLATLLALIAGGAAGIYGGVHYWAKYRSLAAQHKTAERELSETRLQLERLANLERLMAASNAPMPQTKNEEVGVPPLQSHLQNGSAEAAPANGAPAATQTAPPATAQDNNPPAPPAQAAQPPRQETPPPASPAEPVAEQPPATPSIESGPLRINAFSARAVSQQRLRLQYELSTASVDNQRMISGSARYIAFFADGASLELPVTDIDGKRFSITRMKPMQTTVRLSPEQKAAEVQKIQVILELSDGSAYMDSYDANQ